MVAALSWVDKWLRPSPPRRRSVGRRRGAVCLGAKHGWSGGGVNRDLDFGPPPSPSQWRGLRRYWEGCEVLFRSSPSGFRPGGVVGLVLLVPALVFLRADPDLLGDLGSTAGPGRGVPPTDLPSSSSRPRRQWRADYAVTSTGLTSVPYRPVRATQRLPSCSSSFLGSPTRRWREDGRRRIFCFGKYPLDGSVICAFSRVFSVSWDSCAVSGSFQCAPFVILA